MPGQQKLPTRLTVITTGMAFPRSADDSARTLQAVASATQGTWGQGDWDGGVGGLGAWSRYSFFANLKLYYQAPGGNHVVTFPWEIYNCLVKVTDTTSGTTSSVYHPQGKTITLSATGSTFIEVFMASTSG